MAAPSDATESLFATRFGSERLPDRPARRGSSMGGKEAATEAHALHLSPERLDCYQSLNLRRVWSFANDLYNSPIPGYGPIAGEIIAHFQGRAYAVS